MLHFSLWFSYSNMQQGGAFTRCSACVCSLPVFLLVDVWCANVSPRDGWCNIRQACLLLLLWRGHVVVAQFGNKSIKWTGIFLPILNNYIQVDLFLVLIVQWGWEARRRGRAHHPGCVLLFLRLFSCADFCQSSVTAGFPQAHSPRWRRLILPLLVFRRHLPCRCAYLRTNNR